MIHKSSNFAGYKGIKFERVVSLASAIGIFQGMHFKFSKSDDIYLMSVRGKKINSQPVNLCEGIGDLEKFNSKVKLQSRRRFRVLLKKLIKAAR